MPLARAYNSGQTMKCARHAAAHDGVDVVDGHGDHLAKLGARAPCAVQREARVRHSEALDVLRLPGPVVLHHAALGALRRDS